MTRSTAITIAVAENLANRISKWVIKWVCGLLLSASLAHADAEPAPRMYGIESGYLVSQWQMESAELIEIFVWQNYGLDVAKYQLAGPQTGTKTLLKFGMVDGVLQARVTDLIDLSTSEIESQSYVQNSLLAKLSGADLELAAEAMLRVSGYWVDTEQEVEVAGEHCKVWQSTLSE